MQVFLPFVFFACLLAGCANPTAAPTSATMTETAVVVTVDYTALPGQGDALHKAMEPLLAEVRKEPHFLGIQVLRNEQEPDRVLLVEQWADMAYYTGPHGTTPHLEAFKGTAMPLLAGPPQVYLWPSVEVVARP